MSNVQLCVSIPPKLKISDFIGYLKGKLALLILDNNPEMENKQARSFWAHGYEVSKVKNVDEDSIVFQTSNRRIHEQR